MGPPPPTSASPLLLPLPVTSLTAGVLGLLHTTLAVAVVLVRRSRQIAYGDGGDKLLARRLRAHGNASEYIPIFLILLALVEVQALVGPGALMGVAALFVVGRIMHGGTFLGTRPFMLGRVGGTFLTLAPIATLAVVLVLLGRVGLGV